MAAALLGFGRIRGIDRPAIAVPLPLFGADRAQLLVDGGATVDPQPEWLVEWAVLGREYARVRLGVEEPSIALLSNGEEPGKGDALRKAAYPLLSEVKGWGNVEGRDLVRASADVIVTDGFTGNVALKTVEGALSGLAAMVFGVLDEPQFAPIADALKLRMLEAAAPLLPDNTGGALLLGVDGVCIISHGASSATAIFNAVRAARDRVTTGVVDRMTAARASSRATRRCRPRRTATAAPSTAPSSSASCASSSRRSSRSTPTSSRTRRACATTSTPTTTRCSSSRKRSRASSAIAWSAS